MSILNNKKNSEQTESVELTDDELMAVTGGLDLGGMITGGISGLLSGGPAGGVLGAIGGSTAKKPTTTTVPTTTGTTRYPTTGTGVTGTGGVPGGYGSPYNPQSSDYNPVNSQPINTPQTNNIPITNTTTSQANPLTYNAINNPMYNSAPSEGGNGSGQPLNNFNIIKGDTTSNIMPTHTFNNAPISYNTPTNNNNPITSIPNNYSTTSAPSSGVSTGVHQSSGYNYGHNDQNSGSNENSGSGTVSCG